MNKIQNKTDVRKILDELMKATSSCLSYFCKSEDFYGNDVNELKNELENTFEKVDMNDRKIYVLEDQSEYEISNEVVLKYIGSMIYYNLIDLDSRDGNKIDTGYPMKYLGEILKYMNNQYDIWKLNGDEFVNYCRELMEMRIPFRMDIMERLWNGSNEYGVGWRNRWVIVDKYGCIKLFDCMKLKLGDVKYNERRERIELIRHTYMSCTELVLFDLEIYLRAPSKYTNAYNISIVDIMNSFQEVDIDICNERVKQYLLAHSSLFCPGSYILENTAYDDKLREWLGNEYQWKLIYRASEHEYTAESFHKYCDNKGPTLIVIKSSEGWIFGGYTTKSWSGDGIYCYDTRIINRGI